MIKYYILKAILKHLNKECSHIKYIKRVDNNTLLIEFNAQNMIYFDLSKSNAQIYKKKHKSFFVVILHNKCDNQNVFCYSTW